MQVKQGSSFRDSPGLRPGFQPWLPPSIPPPSPDRTWPILDGKETSQHPFSLATLLSAQLPTWGLTSLGLAGPQTPLDPSQHSWVTKLRQENHRNKNYLHIALHSLQPVFVFNFYFLIQHNLCPRAVVKAQRDSSPSCQ